MADGPEEPLQWPFVLTFTDSCGLNRDAHLLAGAGEMLAYIDFAVVDNDGFGDDRWGCREHARRIQRIVFDED